MQKLQNVLKNRAVVTLLAIVMVWVSFTFLLVPKAHGCPLNDVEHEYYTDASLTEQCGYRIIYCNCGGSYSWGCRTPYFITTSTPCF